MIRFVISAALAAALGFCLYNLGLCWWVYVARLESAEWAIAAALVLVALCEHLRRGAEREE